MTTEFSLRGVALATCHPNEQVPLTTTTKLAMQNVFVSSLHFNTSGFDLHQSCINQKKQSSRYLTLAAPLRHHTQPTLAGRLLQDHDTLPSAQCVLDLDTRHQLPVARSPFIVTRQHGWSQLPLSPRQETVRFSTPVVSSSVLIRITNQHPRHWC
jgi:hypothetical protein